uniref:Uncharacterized protein n=1 Tax=viral metagenome TaxID=1070528 RepID=A0A6M3L6Q8_9ZZZZ
MAEYISRHAELGLRLRSSRREYQGGRWTFLPGLRVQFHNGKYRTNNPEIIKHMDGMLNGERANKWRNWFTKVPSQKEIDEITRVMQQGEEARKKAVEEMPKEKKDEYKRFDEYMKTQKDSPEVAKTVSGMRSIGK